VINDNIYLDIFYIILSYVPQLRRLSIPVFFESDKKRRNMFPIVLNSLTHISLRLDFINFDHFELLIKDLFHNLQILCITTSHDITYLDADRWQHLILSHMPNLSIFNIQYIYFEKSNGNAISIFDALINKFNSSFWIERQWFFATQYHCELDYDNIIFYSTKPYK